MEKRISPKVKRLIKPLIVCGLLLLMWLMPYAMKNVSISLIADRSFDGRSVAVTIVSKDAYRQSFTMEKSVQNGELTFFLPYEYASFDTITVQDPAFATSISGMKVLGNAAAQGDYVCASYTGDIIDEQDGAFVLNPTAGNIIDDGRTNPWLGKLIVTALVLMISALCYLCAFMKKRFGTFKAILVLSFILVAIIVLAVCIGMAPFGITIHIAGHAVSNLTLVAVVVIATMGLLTACVIFDDDCSGARRVIVLIYVAALIFSAGKMVFYAEKVGRTPDEPTHIAYVASCEKTDAVVIPFEEKQALCVLSDDTETMHAKFEAGTVNNLRHPPLYYLIVKAFGGVTFLEDGTFVVDLDRVRGVGMVMVLAALGLIMYIGYTRLKKIPLVHMLYATVAVSVPMLTFVASGVNNDNLALLTVTLSFFGLIRYCEKKRNAATYLLIALGIVLSLLTKMTAGMIVTIASLIVLAVTIRRENNIHELRQPSFLATVPLYLLAAAYYVFVFVRYGAFQPSLASLNESYANTTGFYPSADVRTTTGFAAYIGYFWGNFFLSWTGISSHIKVLKPGGCAVLEFLGLGILLVVPMFLLSKTIRRDLSHTKPIGAMYAGVLVTMVVQFINGYTIMTERGYFGGVQSRYYLCAIAVLALCTALLVQKVLVTTRVTQLFAGVLHKTMTVCTIVFIATLVYSDFLYFLIHNTQYLT